MGTHPNLEGSIIELPYLSATQVDAVERLLNEAYGILPLQSVEQTGHNLARLAQQWLDEDVQDRPIVVLAGRGNKGAGGLGAARHLLDWGAWVQIVLTDPPEAYAGIAGQQLENLVALGVPLAWAEEGWELPPADLVIDALVGVGLRGAPRGKVRALIQLANSSVAPILSLSTPSGVDAFTGELYTPHIHASATLLLALPTAGIVQEPSRSAWGDLYLADSGVPPQLYPQLGLAVPDLFARDTIVPLDVEEGRVFLKTSPPGPLS